MILLDGKIYRLKKAVTKARMEVDCLSCSVNSKNNNRKASIKKRGKVHKKRRTAEYGQVDKGAAMAIKTYDNACIMLEKAEAKHRHAKDQLYTYLVYIAEIPNEHRDNVEYEFEPKHRLIHLFFGGYGKPKGEGHAHYGLDERTGEFIFRLEIGQKRTGRRSRIKYRRKELGYEKSLNRQYC